MSEEIEAIYVLVIKYKIDIYNSSFRFMTRHGINIKTSNIFKVYANIK